MPGEVIAGRYVLERIIGEGSYSRVFLGFDTHNRRKVAIKEMKSTGLSAQEADESQRIFFRELNILKQLNHPSIPRVYDFFLFRGRHYMVMEWVEGKNLLSLLEMEGILPEKRAIRLMEQVCDALVYLQDDERKIIYKDLKPSNIIVDESGNAKLIDFGTARFYSPDKRKDTHVLGTPGYAPPEAYSPDNQTDYSADVYSLGATFYHLTTGQEPVQFRFRFPDPAKFNRNLPENFSDLLLDCLKPAGRRIDNAKILMKRIHNCRGEVLSPSKSAVDTHKNDPLNIFLMLIFFAVTNAFLSICTNFSRLLEFKSPFISVYHIIAVVFFPVMIIHHIVRQVNSVLNNRYKSGYIFLYTICSYILIMSFAFVVLSFISRYF